MPLQSQQRLAELLAQAGVHLLPQRPDAVELVMVGKLPGMLASG